MELAAVPEWQEIQKSIRDGVCSLQLVCAAAADTIADTRGHRRGTG